MEIAKKKRGHRKPIPYEEQKVMVFHTVKRKHFLTASKAVKKLCEQWR